LKGIKTNRNNKENEKNSPAKALAIGIAIAYLITFIVFIVYALLLTYTEITEKNIPLVVMITVVFSVAIAGFNAARGADKKGWLWGMGAGLIYSAIMLLIGISAVPVFSFGAKTIMIIVLSIASGGLGGIVGINAKK